MKRLWKFLGRHKEWLFSGLGVAALGLLVKVFTGLSGTQLAVALWSGFLSLGTSVLVAVNHPVVTHAWVLPALFIAGVASTVAFSLLYARWVGSGTVLEPSFIKFTELEFGNNLYRWRWQKNYHGDYQVEDITVLCSRCKARYVNVECVICGGIEDMLMTDEVLRARIEWKIDEEKRKVGDGQPARPGV